MGDPREPSALIECPKCHIRMERLDTAGVEVDRCLRCGGIWLDQGELDTLLRARNVVAGAIARLDAGPAMPGAGTRHQVGQVDCPRDRVRMTTVRDRRQPHIAFEACGRCGGVFMDRGELTDLSEFTLRERLAVLLGPR